MSIHISLLEMKINFINNTFFLNRNYDTAILKNY